MSASHTGSKTPRFEDLTNRRFERLVAIKPLDRRARDGSICWLCRCDCGTLTVASSNKLLQGRKKSCGCYREEVMRSSRTFVGGTCLEVVRSQKRWADNTSGVRHVSRSRGLWQGTITFAGRRFFLGRYKNIAEAAAVARAAEKLRDQVVDDIVRLQDNAVEVLAEQISELLKDVREQKRDACG